MVVVVVAVVVLAAVVAAAVAVATAAEEDEMIVKILDPDQKAEDAEATAIRLADLHDVHQILNLVAEAIFLALEKAVENNTNVLIFSQSLD